MADGLRVLAVTNLWPTGGDFRGVFVQEQVEALRRLGHHVDVEVVAQERGKTDYLLAGARVRARARAYDIVHVHYGLTAFAGRFTGGVPRVLSLYGSDVNAARQRFLTRLGWRGYDARIFVSRRLAATAGDPAGDVIPNGVDYRVFQPVDRAAAREALGIGPDEPVVLFGAAPHNAVKRYDVFTAVMAALRERGVAARELILAVPGQPTSGVVARLAAADVLLFTSRQGSEGSPTVVKEAASVGLPVVTVDVGDVADILAGITPSAVVPFPSAEAHGPSAEAHGPCAGAQGPAAKASDGAPDPVLVTALADRTAAILAARTRADGRERLAWLDSAVIGQRIVEVYRRVLA